MASNLCTDDSAVVLAMLKSYGWTIMPETIFEYIKSLPFITNVSCWVLYKSNLDQYWCTEFALKILIFCQKHLFKCTLILPICCLKILPFGLNNRHIWQEQLTIYHKMATWIGKTQSMKMFSCTTYILFFLPYICRFLSAKEL